MPKRAHDNDEQDDGSNYENDDQASASVDESSTTRTREQVKRPIVESDTLESETTRPPWMTCTLPPRCNTKPLVFYDASSFETHYQKYHCHFCQTCLANFPTDRFLDLHIEESHNAIFAARLARGEPLYRCFEDYCLLKFSSATSRRRHLEKVHLYPPEFRFNIVQRGLSKNTQSLLYPQPRSNPKGTSMKDSTATDTSCQMTEKVSGIEHQAPPTRAQRRALARESGELGQSSPSKVSLGTTRAETPVPVIVKQDARVEHAKAIETLFRGLEQEEDGAGLDDLEPQNPTSMDSQMDALADEMQTTKLVPRSIRFGHR